MQVPMHQLTKAGVIVVTFFITSAPIWLGCDFIAPEEALEEVASIDSVGASDSVALKVGSLRPTSGSWATGGSGDGVCTLPGICPSELPGVRDQP